MFNCIDFGTASNPIDAISISLKCISSTVKPFETYAKIDQWKSDGTQIFAMRDDSEISDYKELVEQLVRVNPDVIITDDGEK